MVQARREILPLSLYSVGSSLLALILSDEDALEFA